MKAYVLQKTNNYNNMITISRSVELHFLQNNQILQYKRSLENCRIEPPKVFYMQGKLQHWKELLTLVKAILDKGLRSRVQWNWTFLLVKSFKLIPRMLNKDPRPRQIKLWFSLHDIILEGKPIGSDQKKNLKENSWFGKQSAS